MKLQAHKLSPFTSSSFGAVLQRQPAECCEKHQTNMQRAAINVEVPPVVHEVLRSSGQPLDMQTRAFMEPRFGHDFSNVRVHKDTKAAESARAVNALAYTVGQDIVYSADYPNLRSAQSPSFLAHELAHVVQQGRRSQAPEGSLVLGEKDSPLEREAHQAAKSVSARKSASRLPLSTNSTAMLQRQGMGDLRIAEYRQSLREKIKPDYKKAEKANKAYAKRGPAWESKLETVQGGAFKAWHDLWSSQQFDAFADSVASYQIDLGFPEKSIDGVLGPGTWWRIAGLGEAMAGIGNVTWPQSENVCTVATEERIKRGYKLATGKAFELPEDKTLSHFKVILQSITNRMLDVEVQYRGAGAAGALVYAGLGEFVPEADIWAGKLEPGAAIQVWGYRKAYDLLQAGEIEKKGKKRRVTDADADFYGTSFVFVRYDSKTKERMLVRHYGRTESKARSDYEVWVAANAHNS